MAKRFMVAAHTSTIDWQLEHGADIAIEQRPGHEVTGVFTHPVAPDGVAAYNPAFDVTPAELVSAIVTERGVIINPNANEMRGLKEETV